MFSFINFNNETIDINYNFKIVSQNIIINHFFFCKIIFLLNVLCPINVIYLKYFEYIYTYTLYIHI